MRSKIRTKPAPPEIGDKTYDSFFCIIPRFLPVGRSGCIHRQWRWLENVTMTSECIGRSFKSHYRRWTTYWATSEEIAEHNKQLTKKDN